MWRLMATTDVGKEAWSKWEILDTLYPYDQQVYVRAFTGFGVLLVWSKLEARTIVDLLRNRVTRIYRIVPFELAVPPKSRDVVSAARALVGEEKSFHLTCEVRGDYLDVRREELIELLRRELKCFGGEKRLIVEVVWDVVGLLFNEKPVKLRSPISR